MDPLLIVANLKSNKTEEEAKTWAEELNKASIQNKEIVVCPSFIHLSTVRKILSPGIKLGAQDISIFDEGPYTGEVNGKQLKEFVSYVLIGHSERRESFKEDQVTLEKKVNQAIKFGITPIFCVQDENTEIPENVKIVAYEPVFAIGSGNPDTPENAKNVADSIRKKNPNLKVLYGGSLNSENVRSFTNTQSIRGVLVGGASLDINEFTKIIEKA